MARDNKERGQGQSAPRIEVTRRGYNPGVFPRTASSEGESTRPGTTYSSYIVQRSNSANETNWGPSRGPSVIGGKELPILTSDQAPRGRVG